MEKIEDIFVLLSGEKKSLKPEHAYKAGEEGLLRAFYFFRWLNKKDYKTLDDVVEAFNKNKIPEQQLEHFGSALVMIDHYETDDRVKKALVFINDAYKEKTGKEVLYNQKDKRIERRVLKNIYQIFTDSLDRLRNRTVDLKKSNTTVWVMLVIILAVNIALVATGAYYNLLMSVIPGLMIESQIMSKYGVAVLAGILFIVPSLLMLVMSRHKLSEQAAKGGEYPEAIARLEEDAKKFRSILEEMKINLGQNGTETDKPQS